MQDRELREQQSGEDAAQRVHIKPAQGAKHTSATKAPVTLLGAPPPRTTILGEDPTSARLADGLAADRRRVGEESPHKRPKGTNAANGEKSRDTRAENVSRIFEGDPFLTTLRNSLSNMINPANKESKFFGGYPAEKYEAAMENFDNYVKELHLKNVADIGGQARKKADEIYSGVQAYVEANPPKKVESGASSKSTPGILNCGTIMIPGVETSCSSPYGPRNLFGRDFHYGVDYRAKEGSKIYLPDIGAKLTVNASVSGHKIAGNFVILEGTLLNGDKITMQINHMQNNSVKLKKGQNINAGDFIGNVGNTGQSTGSHMDLKIKINGKYVDPDLFLPQQVKATADEKHKKLKDMAQ